MRALALLGGGSKGAYQVGALSHLIGDRGIIYDIYCGVSVGALNASLLSMFGEGSERDSAAALIKVWRSIETRKIRKPWFPFSILHMLWKPSLYDSTPLIDLVKSELDLDRIKSSKKKLSVGAVSLSTNEYRMFNQDNPNIKEAVLASSSFPGMLCPIEIDGQLWTDGCIRNISLLKEAISLGADSIDVIMTTPEVNAVEFAAEPNAIDVVVRTLDVISDEIMDADLKITQLINRLVDARRIDKRKISIRILRPKIRLNSKSLEFNQKDIREMIEIGYKDAVELCEE